MNYKMTYDAMTLTPNITGLPTWIFIGSLDDDDNCIVLKIANRKKPNYITNAFTIDILKNVILDENKIQNKFYRDNTQSLLTWVNNNKNILLKIYDAFWLDIFEEGTNKFDLLQRLTKYET